MPTTSDSKQDYYMEHWLVEEITRHSNFDVFAHTKKDLYRRVAGRIAQNFDFPHLYVYRIVQYPTGKDLTIRVSIEAIPQEWEEGWLWQDQELLRRIYDNCNYLPYYPRVR